MTKQAYGFFDRGVRDDDGRGSYQLVDPESNVELFAGHLSDGGLDKVSAALLREDYEVLWHDLKSCPTELLPAGEYDEAQELALDQEDWTRWPLATCAPDFGEELWMAIVNEEPGRFRGFLARYDFIFSAWEKSESPL